MRVFLLLLFLSGFNLVAQNEVSVFGFVRDAQTGEVLIGANVVDKISNSGVVTNMQGFYNIKCKQGDSLLLNFSYIGYKTEVHLLNLNHSYELQISLVRLANLQEVVVTAQKNSIAPNEMSLHRLAISDVKRLPAMGGEVDVLKTIQMLPGIQSSNDGSSGFNVRGGSNDQNLVLVDGVPLYYVNHLGGFVSIFNADAINNVEIVKGGFPAQYGNRLSSVLDVRMKEGSHDKYRVSGTIGMVTSKICVEGPIKKDTSSFLVSYRRYLYDLVTRPISKIALDGISTGYTFYDLNLKTNYSFTTKDRVFFNFYMGDDLWLIKMKKPEMEVNKAEMRNQWGNIMASVRWNHVWSPNLFSNTTVYNTRYRYQIKQASYRNSGFSEQLYRSQIIDFGCTAQWDWLLSKKLKTVFGCGAIYHQFIPSTWNTTDYSGGVQKSSNLNGYSPKVMEFNGYIEQHISVASRFDANIGLRAMNWDMSDTAFLYIEPRVVAGFKISSLSLIKASFSQMIQPVHLLVSEGAGMPVDYWIPATAKLKPQNSTQMALGFETCSKNYQWKYTAEAYYKTMNNLVSFEEGVAYIGSGAEWESGVEPNGNGKALGLELMVEKTVGHTTGWLSYTLSKSNRLFEFQNNGKTYPFKYDRRHNFGIVLMHRLSPKVDIGVTWVYYTGQAITLATGRYNAIDDNDYLMDSDTDDMVLYKAQYYGGKNSFRMRDHHRLDVGINFTKKKSWGERVWNVSIYNLYGRQNPFFVYWDMESNYDFETGDIEPQKATLKQFSLFPFMPSISYSFKF